MQDEICKSLAGANLFHSLRLEQSIITGFLLGIEDVLTVLQKGVLDSACYPWSPEWLPLCALISLKRGKQPLQFPAFIDKFLDLPLLPQRTPFEVKSFPLSTLYIFLSTILYYALLHEPPKA